MVVETVLLAETAGRGEGVGLVRGVESGGIIAGTGEVSASDCGVRLGQGVGDGGGVGGVQEIKIKVRHTSNPYQPAPDESIGRNLTGGITPVCHKGLRLAICVYKMIVIKFHLSLQPA